MTFLHRAPRCPDGFYAGQCPALNCHHAPPPKRILLTPQRVELLVAIEACWRVYGHGPSATGKRGLSRFLKRKDASVRGMIEDLRIAGWLVSRGGSVALTAVARREVFGAEREAA